MIDQTEIHRKTMSGVVTERIKAVEILRDNFAVLSDKKQAWDGLIRLTMDQVGGDKNICKPFSGQGKYIIESALSSINVQMINLQEQLAEKDRWIEYLKDVVLKRWDTINYSVFKLKLRSGEIIPTLREIQTELNKLKTIQTDLKNVGLSLTERDLWFNRVAALSSIISLVLTIL